MPNDETAGRRTTASVWSGAIVIATVVLGWSLGDFGALYLAALIVVGGLLATLAWWSGRENSPRVRLGTGLVGAVGLGLALISLLVLRDPLATWPFLATAIGAAFLARWLRGMTHDE